MGTSYHCPFITAAEQQSLCQGKRECPLGPLQNVGVSTHRMGCGGSRRPGGILIIGEAPGDEEDKQGKPFVGRSGRLLRSVIQTVGMDMRVLTFTNSVRCHPPQNKTPSNTVVALCAGSHLVEEIKRLAPRVIVTVGSVALKALFGKSTDGVTKVKELQLTHPTDPSFPPVIAAYHPAYVLRNERMYKPSLQRSLQKAWTIYQALQLGRSVKVRHVGVTVKTPDEKNVQEVFDYIAHIGQGHKFSYDVETTGLNPWKKDKTHRILTLSLSASEQDAMVLGFDHADSPMWTTTQRAEIQQRLANLFMD